MDGLSQHISLVEFPVFELSSGGVFISYAFSLLHPCPYPSIEGPKCTADNTLEGLEFAASFIPSIVSFKST